eukprot:2045015-Pleurochrysis_carterae.AAC.1
MDEVSREARESAKNLQDQRGDHMPAPQCILVLRLLERGGRAYNGGKQARLSVRKSEGGPKGREGGASSGDGADDLELEELMVLHGRGVVHDTVRMCIQAVRGMNGGGWLPHGTGSMHCLDGSKPCMEGQGMPSADLVAVHCDVP